jgi:NAD(P)-dependent dehydrogenase (short-subunit alcohol dehydrogenase family)
VQTLLITGANRGLGLELTRQYLADGWRVHACCRRPDEATGLADVAAAAGDACRVHALDVTDHAAIDDLAGALGDEALDLVINNAGVLLDRSMGGLGETDYALFQRSFAVNTMAPLKVAEAFTPHLCRGDRKLLVALTSRMGSIADNTSGGYYTYRATKAALNMIWKSLSLDLRGRGIACAVLHPGWARTDMGGAGANLGVGESVRGMRRVIDALDRGKTGRFFNHDGTELPW